MSNVILKKWEEQSKVNGAFNEKWKDYLTTRHYGMDIGDEKIAQYLDQEFTDTFSKLPNFQYQQIKLKFGKARFYFSADISFEATWALEKMVENKIDEILGV